MTQTGRYTQAHHRMAIHTPLGTDQLLLTRFHAKEQFSRPYRYDVVMHSERDDIGAAELVGKAVCVELDTPEDEPVYFHGHVERFARVGRNDRLSIYAAEIVPWLSFLSRTVDCRIFQNRTVPEIIVEVFKNFGLKHFEQHLTGKHVPWEYCVQYRESAFDFVSRLMEQEGIYYFFRHAEDRHTLVLSDSRLSYHVGRKTSVSVATNAQGSMRFDELSSWKHSYLFTPGRVAINDFNFTMPSAKLMASHKTRVQLPGTQDFTIYDYPGEYERKDEGIDLAEVRMEELDVQHSQVEAAGSCRWFSPGTKFRINHHWDHTEEGKEYVVTAIEHTMTADGFTTNGAGTAEYANGFTCIPASVVYRPDRVTPKPVVRGVQTAMVTGPAGKEIYTDKYGRVKVHFHWDRHGAANEQSSCWMRVSMPWAGRGWGGVQIPRIGQEVIVDFLEGDPDRPIITGRVYNAESMPPLSGAGRPGSPPKPASMEEASHFMSLRSNSLGGSGGHNEITMNDAGGSETLYVKAQKDETHEVGNDRKDTVGHDEVSEVKNDRTDTVGNNETRTVKNNRTRTVMVNETITINANRSLTVQANETYTVNQCRMLTVAIAHNNATGAVRTVETGLARIEVIGALELHTVGYRRFTLVGGTDNLTVGKDRTEDVGTTLTVTSGDTTSFASKKDFLVTATGNAGIKAAKMLVLECPDITLKAGGNFIRINASGIYISGKPVFINSGGAAGALPAPEKASASADASKEADQKGGEQKPGAESAPKEDPNQCVPGGDLNKEIEQVAKQTQEETSNMLQEYGIPKNTADLLGKLTTDNAEWGLTDIWKALPSASTILSKVPDGLLGPKTKKALGLVAQFAGNKAFLESQPDSATLTNEQKDQWKKDHDEAVGQMQEAFTAGVNQATDQALKATGISTLGQQKPQNQSNSGGSGGTGGGGGGGQANGSGNGTSSGQAGANNGGHSGKGQTDAASNQNASQQYKNQSQKKESDSSGK